MQKYRCASHTRAHTHGLKPPQSHHPRKSTLTLLHEHGEIVCVMSDHVRTSSVTHLNNLLYHE